MATKFHHRFLDIIMNEFSSKTFSVSFMPHATGFVHKELHKGVSFHYIVPETLCRTHIVNGKQSKPQFSAAAIMAIFDEVSTYSCAMKDRKMRPGLSVHLSTELVQNIYAGEEVTILTQADKIGKTLGYASLEVLNQKGELLARGKHIKHLPMGPWFDFITHPVIAPISLALHEFTHKREKAKKEKDGNHDLHKVTGFPTLKGVGKVFDILGLTRFIGKVPSPEAELADNNIFCSDSGRVDASDVKSYTMTVKQMTSNLRNTMHGGAVGCAVEHACLLSRSGNTQSDGSAEGCDGVYDMDCYIQSLEVRYISPMRGDLIITAANDRHSPLLYAAGRSAPSGLMAEEARRWCTKSLGKVLNKSDGSVCAEYVCTWALH